MFLGEEDEEMEITFPFVVLRIGKSISETCSKKHFNRRRRRRRKKKKKKKKKRKEKGRSSIPFFSILLRVCFGLVWSGLCCAVLCCGERERDRHSHNTQNGLYILQPFSDPTRNLIPKADRHERGELPCLPDLSAPPHLHGLYPVPRVTEAHKHRQRHAPI